MPGEIDTPAGHPTSWYVENDGTPRQVSPAHPLPTTGGGGGSGVTIGTVEQGAPNGGGANSWHVVDKSGITLQDIQTAIQAITAGGGSLAAVLTALGSILSVEVADSADAAGGTLADAPVTDPNAGSASRNSLLRGELVKWGGGLPTALVSDALKVWLVSALNSTDDSVTAVQGAPGATPWPVTETRVAPFINHRRFNLPTSGTAVRLSVSSVPLSTGVFIKAADGNTAKVYSSCDPAVTPGTVAATDGMELSAGDGSPIAVDDLNKVYVVPGADNQNIYVQYA